MRQLPEVPGYRLTALVGEGGMGRVYLGQRVSDEKKVAVKFIRPQSNAVRNRVYARRFRREIAICKDFTHPNVVKVIDGGSLEANESLFLVMDYLEGETLEQCMNWGAIEHSLALRVAQQIAQAFKYFHPMGYVHRDIKPSNIFLTDPGTVVLLDFGLAHASDMTRITETHEMPGTFFVMAPEQLQGKPLDGRTDIYQLGVSLYRALVGRAPFDRTQILRMYAGGNVDAPSFRGVDPPVPERLQAVVQTCMHIDREARFQCADDLITALDALELDGSDGHTRGAFEFPDTVVTQPSGQVVVEGSSPSPRRPTLMALLIVAGVAALAITALWLRTPTTMVHTSERTPIARGPTEELTLLRLGLMSLPTAPPSEEAKQLGALLIGTGVGTEQALPEGAPTEVTGLLYLARSCRKQKKDDKVWPLYEALAVRHGVYCLSSEGGALLEEVLTAAHESSASENLAQHLRSLLRDNVLSVEQERRLRVALATALWQGYRSRYPDDRDKESRPHPLLIEATQCLAPLFLKPFDKAPPEKLVALYLQLLEWAATTQAKDECLRFMRLHPSPSAHVYFRAAKALDSVNRTEPWRRTKDMETSIDYLGKGMSRCVTHDQEAPFRTRMAWLLCKLKRSTEGLAVIEPVRPSHLRQELRWRFFRAKGDVLNGTGQEQAALEIFATGLRSSDDPEQVKFFQMKVREMRMKLLLLGGK